MALWGNNDNLVSSGTVSLNYATKTVTGTGTTFVSVGFGVTGDVIRFGIRGSAGTYFGDAVITGITSARVMTIGSTDGLSGAAIAATSYYLSELPQYTVHDHHYSNLHDNDISYVNYRKITAHADAGIGVSVISLNRHDEHLVEGTHTLRIGGADIAVSSIGVGTVTAALTSDAGASKIYLEYMPSGVTAKNSQVQVETGGQTRFVNLVSVASTYVEVGTAHTLSARSVAGAGVPFKNNNIVGLAGTIGAAITKGDHLQFRVQAGGYDRQVYGISEGSSQGAVSTEYRTEGTGWVGVTTYIDAHGNLRVKKETLVAASGIQTGSNGILYPTGK